MPAGRGDVPRPASLPTGLRRFPPTAAILPTAGAPTAGARSRNMPQSPFRARPWLASRHPSRLPESPRAAGARDSHWGGPQPVGALRFPPAIGFRSLRDSVMGNARVRRSAEHRNPPCPLSHAIRQPLQRSANTCKHPQTTLMDCGGKGGLAARDAALGSHRTLPPATWHLGGTSPSWPSAQPAGARTRDKPLTGLPACPQYPFWGFATHRARTGTLTRWFMGWPPFLTDVRATQWAP